MPIIDFAYATEGATKPQLCCGEPWKVGLHPIDLWNEYELIFDGTIMQIDNNTNPATYHIAVNQVFKGNDKTSLISAQGNTILSTGTRALFYINKFNATNYIAPYSITTSKDCDARDLIPLSTLPGEPIGRGGPTLEFLIDHPCKPSYFKSRVSPLQQFKSGIPTSEIKCKEGLTLVIKARDGLPACVKPATVEKLVERDWTKSSEIKMTSKYSGLTDEQKMDIQNAKLGCTKTGNQTACDETIQEKINYYRELNGNPCSEVYLDGLDTFQQPLSQTSPKRLVLFMKQNSTAQMCVKYTSPFDNTGLLEVYPGILVRNPNFEPAPVSEIIINAEPNYLPLDRGANTIVIYTITSQNNSKGVYWMGISQICELIPVIVGINSLELSSWDIPVFLGFQSCPNQELDAKIIGVSNATVEYKIGQPIGKP